MAKLDCADSAPNLYSMTSPRLHSRAIVRLAPLEEGEDVSGFLQGLVTNDVKETLPCYAALLSAQGKTLFELLVWPGPDGALLLDCEAQYADELVKRLSLYRLRRKIAITREDTLGVYWRPHLGDGGAPDPRLAGLGERWIAVCQDSDHAADAAWLRWRLELGVPEGRAELGDILWLETNAMELNGVSFTKGCYVGQENTARMNWRQKINRRLIVLPIDRSDEKRRVASYPELGLAVDHLRVEGIDPSLLPAWLHLADSET